MKRKSRDESVAEEFDRAARSYDKSRLVKSYQRRTQTLVIGRMHIEKGMNVLDLGCGTGSGAIDVASKLEGTGRVVGLDLSEKMIDQAKQKATATGYANVEFRVGGAASLDCHSLFDYVLSTNAFHHFDQKEEVFSRVWRSLKPGGVFLVQDICDDYLLMRLVDLAGKVGERAHVGSTTSKELGRLFRSTGFVRVEVEKLELNWFWRIMIGIGTRPSGG
jgi:arsenite methyltransferase